MAASGDPTEPSAAHVPMTEEFDSFRHTLPNAAPVAVAMLLVAVVLALFAFFLRARPAAAGAVEEAFAVNVPGQNGSLAIVGVSFQNLTAKPLRLMNVNVAVQAKGAVFSDDFGSASDFPRYFEAFPALKEHARAGLMRDARYGKGEKASGSAIVALPITQQEFDARDSLTVTLRFEGHAPVKIMSGKRP